MRRVVLLFSFFLVLAPVAARAVPLKRVSMAEFERLLSALKGQSDGKVAKLVSSLELTERASAVRLARWESEFPGRHSQEAFLVLSDSSAFFNLPADEIPATAPPDIQAQRAILVKTIEYMQTAISRLPDFYATRKTENYQDMPGRLESYNRNTSQTSLAGLDPKVIPYEPLLDAGKSSIMVRYVDGREVLGTKKNDESPSSNASVLTSHGEFGSMFSAILQDAIKNKIYWGHWEQGTGGTFAVFRYWVLQEQTSYEVTIPDVPRGEPVYPAFHGEIGVDPATGAILRITVVADFAPPHQQAISSILVEYGPVAIGGKSFICPIHSVALARFAVPDALGPVNRIDTVPATRFKTELNDVAFVEYHQFRAESRILVDNPIDTPEPPAPHK